MMADLLRPDFDDKWYSTYWKEALDDLTAASSGGEITHVQLRIWNYYDAANQTDWNYPRLGSNDPGQSPIMEQWKRWYFGEGDPPLAYGPCAAERIHMKGFKLEFCISAAWNPGQGTMADVTPVFKWGAKESDYPQFNGTLFLQNYMDNVLRPTAEFLANDATWFQDGDIFMLSFEMVYPTADFTWSHNEEWKSMISTVRNIFRAAGKSIVLTIDHSCWYDDFGLGYNAVKLLNSSAPILPEEEGISGASYLGELDFISLSWWLPVLLSEDIPENWTDQDIPWVADAWFSNKNEYKVGTGYRGVPGVLGRNYIADMRAFSMIMGKKMLMNTGWRNQHGRLAWTTYGGEKYPDNMEQRVVWAAQLAAIGDPRSNFTVWCAGQDFERYCRDKAAQPDFIDTSWRNAPAQEAIMEGIRVITS